MDTEDKLREMAERAQELQERRSLHLTRLDDLFQLVERIADKVLATEIEEGFEAKGETVLPGDMVFDKQGRGYTVGKYGTILPQQEFHLIGEGPFETRLSECFLHRSDTERKPQ